MDSSDEELIKIGVQVISKKLVSDLRKKKRKPREVWVKPWLQRRDELGMSDTLCRELEVEDPVEFQSLMRISPEKYRELLDKVTPMIKKQDTHLRAAVPAKTKLDLTLRLLASGCSLKDLSWEFRVHPSTISKFLPITLEAIAQALQSEHLKMPSSTEEWSAIQQVFDERWNFPGCCGAIDGKHVRIQCPPKSGSIFHNYKEFFSTILMAVVDGNYCFTFVDFGTNGKANDSTVFRNSAFYAGLENGTLNLPPGYVFVADDAFGMKHGILKRYPRSDKMDDATREYNYRLSRARRTSENAFGILVTRFRIYRTPIALSLETTDLVVKATIALHNWLRRTSPNYYTPASSLDVEDLETGEIQPGSWREEIQDCPTDNIRFGSNNHGKSSGLLREAYKEFFQTHGRVPWQRLFARRNQ